MTTPEPRRPGEHPGEPPGQQQPVRPPDPGREAARSRPARELLRTEGIRKTFPGVVALDGVDFDVRAGEVHVLLGENGAGKSTLIKVLSGVYRPDGGQVLREGRPVRIAGAPDAEQLGIATIHQEFTLVPDLSVAENIYLGRQPRRFGLVQRKRMAADAAELLARVGVDVPPDTPVRALGIAQCQMVEIAKALSLHARILIMDEPTATLTAGEVDRLFTLVRRLIEDGVGIVFITHHLEEIAALGDRVTVIRDGRSVGQTPANTPRDELVRMMVGRSIEQQYPRHSARIEQQRHNGGDRGNGGDRSAGRRGGDSGGASEETPGTVARTPAEAPSRSRAPAPSSRPATPPPADPPLLRVTGLTRKKAFADVTFEVRAGEVVGLAGLVGAGRTEVARAVFGADGYDAGAVEVEGRRLPPHDVQASLAAGVGLVPEDRKGQGLLLDASVEDNLGLVTMRSATRAGFVDRSGQRREAARIADRLAVRMSGPEALMRTLSGGNQQKVVIGKWLLARSRLLILDEPTRGVDVGAKVEIYELINELTESGHAVLMISSDLPEVLGMSDRVLVMAQGRLVGELASHEADQDAVMRLAVGKSVDGDGGRAPRSVPAAQGTPAAQSGPPGAQGATDVPGTTDERKTMDREGPRGH